MNRTEILTYFHNNKILLQGLINKVTKLQKRIEVLENKKQKNNEENITDNIISILATYDTKLELLVLFILKSFSIHNPLAEFTRFLKSDTFSYATTYPTVAINKAIIIYLNLK